MDSSSGTWIQTRCATRTCSTSARARWPRAGSSASCTRCPPSSPPFRRGLSTFLASLRGRTAPPLLARTERDLPMSLVLVGSALLVLTMWLAPPLHINLLSALLIVVCGFFFVTVSARVTGEIGSSSNPISGMVVATLLFTCLVYLLLGWTSAEDRFMAL